MGERSAGCRLGGREGLHRTSRRPRPGRPLVEGPLDDVRETAVVALHRDLDSRAAAVGGQTLEASTSMRVACPNRGGLAPSTWTHGRLVHCTFPVSPAPSWCTTVLALFGRPPTSLLPPMSEQQVRGAARDELCAYWARTSRRPQMWLNPVIADLGLNLHGLLSKTEAIEQAPAPDGCSTCCVDEHEESTSSHHDCARGGSPGGTAAEPSGRPAGRLAACWPARGPGSASRQRPSSHRDAQDSPGQRPEGTDKVLP